MSIRRRVIWTVLSCALIGVLATAAVLWTQGYRVYVVHTGSMSPTYQPGDVVVDRPAQHHYRAGEVITFRHSAIATDVVTHRITAITAAGLIHTKGDANRTADVWEIRPDQVKGSVMFGVRNLGYLLVFLRQPSGFAASICAVFAVLMLWKSFFPAEDAPAQAPAGSARLEGSDTLVTSSPRVDNSRPTRATLANASPPASTRALTDTVPIARVPALAETAPIARISALTETAPLARVHDFADATPPAPRAGPARATATRRRGIHRQEGAERGGSPGARTGARRRPLIATDNPDSPPSPPDAGLSILA